MMPMIAIIRIRRSQGRSLSLWIPLILIWILLMPLALLLLPLVLIVLAAKKLDPFKGVAAIIGVLTGMSGVSIEIENPHSQVRVVVI